MAHFYTRFISVEAVVAELHGLNLSDEEKIHLASLIDSSIHHAILDEVLSNLKTDDKKLFLKLLSEDEEHEKIINFLNDHVDNIEGRIKKVADELVKEMHEDIRQAKRKKV
ncbi:MAG: hypothetical protein Q7R49_05200 [Candidatus Daviesbacteria bacterium]|nr:hypothetical protein [Candidatus Daviesbacteria bacterium]